MNEQILSNFKRREFLAYEFLNVEKVVFKKNVKLEEFAKLLNKLPNNEFFVEMKINFVLNIMWHFDYLNNYLEDPKKIQGTIDQLYYSAKIYKNFTKSNWIKNHGVRYFNELTNMAQLTEEVGEVARIIARRYGEQSEKDSDKGKDLGEELADVLFVVLCLANQTGIDLQQSFEKKLDIKTKRDHDRHQNNKKLQ